MILATGGTIAGAAATATQPGYTSGQVPIEGMIAAIPGINALAEVSGEQLANVGSQDITFAIMIELANRINFIPYRFWVPGPLARQRFRS